MSIDLFKVVFSLYLSLSNPASMLEAKKLFATVTDVPAAIASYAIYKLSR
jgi:hypothetical protein